MDEENEEGKPLTWTYVGQGVGPNLNLFEGKKNSMVKTKNLRVFWRWVLYDFGAGFCWIEILRCFEVIEFFFTKKKSFGLVSSLLNCVFVQNVPTFYFAKTHPWYWFITLDSKCCMFFLGEGEREVDDQL